MLVELDVNEIKQLEAVSGGFYTAYMDCVITSAVIGTAAGFIFCE